MLFDLRCNGRSFIKQTTLHFQRMSLYAETFSE